MNRIEQLRPLVGQEVEVICCGRSTGFRTSIEGILRENNGVFELWRRGTELVYSFVPRAITSSKITPGYRPALFTRICEEGLNPPHG